MQTLFLKRGLRLAAAALLLPPALAQAAPVTFAIQPAGGTARIITAREFRLCVLRGIDPWSTNCPGWRPVANGQALTLMGRFNVYAAWDYGQSYRGELEALPASGPMQFRIRPVAMRQAPAAR
ncbi:MAG: hypothetical protein JO276_05415 [Sphingomonadaceae bacterium]|nr:hypothetical protein [Sphingomonadaceae bacterium]